MPNDLLLDFFDRILGAFIFITAVSGIVLAGNRLISGVTQVKNEYANDTVYSESALAETDESNISRDELVATIVGGPNKHLTIKDECSGYILQISCGLGEDAYVLYQKGDHFTSDSKRIDFSKDRWDASKLNLSEWLQASSFEIHDATKADGSIDSVLYYGRRT